jgi:rod shape-determining protein MreC
MPSPPHRRTGFSRKAQYGILLGYAVAVAGIIVALLLLAIAVIDPRGFAAIKGAALDATAPVSSGGRSVTGFFSGIGEGIGNYFRAGSQNAELRRELEAARRELMETRIARADNERLRALIGLAGGVEDEVAVGRIVGSSYASARRLATLSAGSSHGVRIGQPVRSADGLLGRVLETGRWASRVLLVSDGASSVPVRSLRGNVPALAVGRGDGTVELRTLEVGENPFRPGDILVTSGVGGIFPPDVPVARVIRIETDTTIARPLADPGLVDIAIVQPVYQPAAAGELAEAPQTSPGGAVSAAQAQAVGATTPPPLQQDPRYQPALQDPQPGQTVRSPSPAPAPAGASPAAAPPQPGQAPAPPR